MEREAAKAAGSKEWWHIGLRFATYLC